jgi:plasmid stabilization system protein ParE
MSQIHFEARLELEDAAVYYAKISLVLADRFLRDYEQTLSFIEAMPLAWASYYLELRKLNFKIFPYSIVYHYSEENNEIIIIAIQHQSRKPFYWKDRI